MALNKILLGFILLSPPDSPVASTRVAVLNILPLLDRLGFAAEVLYAPPQAPAEQPALDLSAAQIAARGFRVVVFQKCRGPGAIALARELESLGVRTIYLVCDFVEPAMAAATSATIVVSDFLRSRYPAELRDRVHVVHDGIERPEVHKLRRRMHHATARDPLRAVLVSSFCLTRLPVIEQPPAWLRVTIVGRYAPRLQWARRLRHDIWMLRQINGVGERLRFLRCVTNRRIDRVGWSPGGVYKEMLGADVGIIPIECSDIDRGLGTQPPDWMVKSENRLTLKMAVGLPVVASPIPSYQPVIRQGANGFLAGDRSEWLKALDALRDPELRAEVGEAARRSVIEAFSMARQAERFIDVVQGLLERRA